jgi:hypothetical protein
MLGWEYGTLELEPNITGEVDDELRKCKIKVRTNISNRKFYSQGQNTWKSKTGNAVHLAVRKRYSSCLLLEFRTHVRIKNKTTAFAVLWLKDISDDEEKTLTLTVWNGDMDRAQTNACDEFGDKVGQIEVKLKLWSGLSGYHLPLAKKDSNVESIMEVLDCANDVNDEQNIGGDISDPDTSSSEGEEDSIFSSTAKKVMGSDSDLQKDGKRGILNDVQEYQQNKNLLHRRNRGVMQWKVFIVSVRFNCPSFLTMSRLRGHLSGCNTNLLRVNRKQKVFSDTTRLVLMWKRKFEKL